MSLEVRELVKSFAGVHALRGVNMRVDDATVHALLGHNGAGKSTLIRCLGGAFAPDSGEFVLGDATFRRLGPRQSIAAGVAIIYQNLSLIDSLSVSDNIFLGQEHRRLGLVRRHAQIAEAESALTRVGAQCSPRAMVGDLSMGQRQLVEIAKAVRREPHILILDEPTAALSAREADVLAGRVAALRADGLAILYITHLLAEVERLADAVTVLRDGMVVYRSAMSGVSRRDLVQAISGTRAEQAPSEAPNLGAVRLAVKALKGPGFGPVSFTVSSGEVLAVHGLIGSGRTRLLETVAGRRRRTGGSVLVDGHQLPTRTPAQALARGVALVPADRKRQGLFTTMSAQDNTLMGSFALLGRLGWRRRQAEKRAFDQVSAAVGLRPPTATASAASFSGGNQQKLVLGRWVSGTRELRALLLDEPTQGVDVGARREIYTVLRALARDSGCAVLVSSSDPEEVVTLADRCLVMSAGRLLADLPSAGLTESRLLELTHQASTVREDGTTA